MSRDVVDLEALDRTTVAVAGGKGALLGELTRIAGIRVPPGFCVTTHAFERVIAEAPALGAHLGRLSRLAPGDRDALGAVSAELRRAIEEIALPDALVAAIEGALARLGRDAACAVRSSATAEDSPTHSFAGQYDTYLDVVGAASVLDHVRRCWASLFTERAVSYRQHAGIDHRSIRMAVIVQRMVRPRAAGVLFTADPLTGHRDVAVVEAGIGLGESLVAGVIAPDAYTVRDGRGVETTIATPRSDVTRRSEGALDDEQVVRLVALGRRIAAHLGAPQDVEWCLDDDGFAFVQSRPITTLFPVPEAGDDARHVYVSVGHQQMMTDPMTPLGISVWQRTATRPMYAAGGRLFVDVARELASPASRDRLVEMLGRSDPLIGDALRTLVERGDVVATTPDAGSAAAPQLPPAAGSIEADPAIVDELIARSERSIAELTRDIRSTSGAALLDFILADIEEKQRVLFDPRSLRVIMAVVEATWWLDDHLLEWLGEQRAADTLSLAAPNNVTSEMGLALLDVADVVRPHREVVAFLERVEDGDFLDALPARSGGVAARESIREWLDRYGMRGVGEIDIARPRWREQPQTLVPLLLGHVRHFEPGEARRRVERGQLRARQKTEEVLTRLRALPDGTRKAEEAGRMIARLRTFAGYREYPKYAKVSREYVYRQALLGEAERLVQAGVLRERDDIFYFTLEELHDVVRTRRADLRLVRARREALRAQRALTPPRVMTSDGEIVRGAYRRSVLPAGALAGFPVSAGVVEGRARVVLDPSHAALEPGDVLVTPFTDPSWTPLFVTIAGLVTEVGGLTTHGAVIAREYGLPAVVGVEEATRRIRDGGRIRVDGTNGVVEILS